MTTPQKLFVKTLTALSIIIIAVAVTFAILLFDFK